MNDTINVIRVREIFRKALAKSEINNIQLTDEQLSVHPEPIAGGNLIAMSTIYDSLFTRDKEFIYQLFSIKSQDRKGQSTTLYHFKRLDIAKELLKRMSLQANNLLAQFNNDDSEFEEFFRRYGTQDLLIPRDYCDKKDQYPYVVKPMNRRIDEIRHTLFILCFTRSYHSLRFWEEYADNDRGVCLQIKVEGFNNNIVRDADNLRLPQLYEFRDVCYDETGYLFDFINEINYFLTREFGKVLYIQGSSIMASCYKRGRYSWEDETRFVLDQQFVYSRYNVNPDLFFGAINIEADQRKYLAVPFSNQPYKNFPFELHLERVICGKAVSPTDMEEIRTLCRNNYDGVEVVRRD